MLDISFYSQDKEEAKSVEIPEDFYKWLAKSEFPKIGKSKVTKMKADGETVELPVILLGVKNRRKFGDFFRDAIVQESDDMLNKLGNSPSSQEYSVVSSKLKMLQDLRKSVENEKHKYLRFL